MLKTSPELLVLCASERLTIPEIGAWSERLWPVLQAELELYGLQPDGPAIFVSYGRDGRLDAPFRHDFCIPVTSGTDYGGAF
ncbi:hypothetical protein KC221_24715, partial [Mycobacterium tuberculosis]|nr:hypothetical protein [Mycobacterium tuberculosis]